MRRHERLFQLTQKCQFGSASIERRKQPSHFFRFLDGERGMVWPEERRAVPSSTQRHVVRHASCSPFVRNHRPQSRARKRRDQGIARMQEVLSSFVFAFGRVEASQNGQLVRLLRDAGKKLADSDTGHRGRDRTRLTTGRSTRFGIERFELTRAAVHPKDDAVARSTRGPIRQQGWRHATCPS